MLNQNKIIINILNETLMNASHTVYQLIKRKKDGSEKIVVETDASSVERAMDYFFIMKPKAYQSKKYRIGIKPKPEFILN